MADIIRMVIKGSSGYCYCDEATGMIPGNINGKIMGFCTDIGGIEFYITYSDKTKIKETYWVPGDYFEELFKVIKSLVPATEYIPAVLMTSEDYGEEEEEDEEEYNGTYSIILIAEAGIKK